MSLRMGILGQVEERWGRCRNSKWGHTQGGLRRVPHTVPSHGPPFILTSWADRGPALLSTVAALSLCLSGWPTFLWVQVTNKEVEATRSKKRNA